MRVQVEAILSWFCLFSPLLLPYEKLTAEVLTPNKKSIFSCLGMRKKNVEQKRARVVRGSIKHTAYDAV